MSATLPPLYSMPHSANLLYAYQLSPVTTLFLRRTFSHLSSTPRLKPRWNSNEHLVVTHPLLSRTEFCESMDELRQIQGQLTRTGLIAHRFPASRALAFCALSDNGDMRHARLLFDQIPDPNTYICNTMIRGYIRCGSPLLGLSFFRDMNANNANLDCRTVVFALKNSLMHFYQRAGLFDCARKVFDEMAERDVVSWTTVIDGYSENGRHADALKEFRNMLAAGVQLNAVTMLTAISACSQIGSLSLGRSFHGYAEKCEFRDSNSLMNALVDMYVKCGCLCSARRVFDSMDAKDVFSWTGMMNGYAKNGDLDLARKFFDEMPQKNVVSWSSMIAGYAQANQPEEALNIFRDMISADVEPIAATLVSALSACGRRGCLDLGRWMYDRYIVGGGLELTVNLSNAFIDMYAKCGDIDEAAKLFHEMKEKNIVSWNSMIMGYGFHGHGREAVALFEQLKGKGVAPDDITFVGVLSSCSHGGLVSEGRRYFIDMKAEFGIEPKPAHYACLVDLLGRVGFLEEAYELVRDMPAEANEAGWGALLNACRVHGNLKLAGCAGERLLGVDSGDSGVYSLLSSIYAAWNKWDELKQVRMVMRDRKVKKVPGCSSIEIDGSSYEFFAADRSQVFSERIYAVLDLIYMQSREGEREASHIVLSY